MNITVYLGASRGNDPSYEADASALGAWIAEHGHTLIYGGSRTGLMGALSAGALKKGGAVIGVEPQEFIDTALQQEGLTKLIVTPDMASRKKNRPYPKRKRIRDEGNHRETPPQPKL